MNEKNRSNKLLTTIVVLLVLVLICMFLLMGTILLSTQMQAEQEPVPQSSSVQEEPELPVSAPVQEVQPSQPEPEEVEESSSSQQEIPIPEPRPAPQPQPQPQPQAQPQPQTQAQPQASSSSSSASQQESSQSSEYQTKTYTKGGYFDSKKTYGDVSIKEGDILLANKTIKGDLTISRYAEGDITLENCTVEGTLYIKGGQTVVLADSRIGKIVVKDYDEREAKIFAEGLTRTSTITAYTDVRLDESGLDPKRNGFSEVTTDGGDSFVSIVLNDVTLTNVTLKKETELLVDFGSVIEKLRVSKPSVIDGDGSIELLVISSNDIISYIEPTKEEKTSQRYDEVDYRTH
ncbi:MAG: hypothetical protein J6Q99_03160 [Oscillospiraceae bacterium]|nr:hypothetical protein [Oscillospiraceae bacterium]